jgi:hypothetical protein
MNFLARAVRSLRESLEPANDAKLLLVEWDDIVIRVRTLDQAVPGFWNQEVRWSDITRVCFGDGGVSKSDILFLEALNRENPVYVLTEAQHGTEFLAQLVARGLFPQKLLEKAIGSSSGEMLCWPPRQSEPH